MKEDAMLPLCNFPFAPLPARTLPHPWEDLASLVSRVAGCMGYRNLHWLLRPEEISSSIQPFNLCMLREKTGYQFFEHLLQLDEETLYRLTLHRFTSCLQTSELPLLSSPSEIRHPFLSRHIFQTFFHPYSATKVCAACLAEESVYGRLYWNVLPIVACLRHKIFLTNQCPSCQSPIPLLRPSLTGCPHCKKGDYREVSTVPLPEDMHFHLGQMQVLVSLGIERAQPRGASVTESGSPLLDLLPWQYFQLLDAFRCILGPLYPDASLLRVDSQRRLLLHPHPRPHSGLSPLEWAVFIATFHEIFTSWPNNFFSFLDAFRQSRASRGRKRDHIRTSGVQRDFGVFYEKWLYKRLAHPSFSFLHAAFEAYLNRRYTEGEITSRLLPFRGATRQQRHERPFLTKVQTLAALGIGEQVLQALMRQGILHVLKKPIGQAGKRTLYLIDKASVEAVRKEWEGLLPLDNVAQARLGVTKAIVLALEQAALLVPARGPSVDGYKIRLYRVSDMEHFSARLLDTAVKVTEPTPPGVPLSQAACVMGIPLVTILKDALGGHLTPIDLDSAQPLMQRLVLPRSEIHRYLNDRERRRREDLGLLTVREAAALLGVDNEVLLRWIRRGALSGERGDGQGKKSRLLIRRTMLGAFRQNYLFTEEVAERLQIVPQTVHKYVRKGILRPVFGRRGGDGGNRLLFLRQEIEALTSDEHVTVREAASLLGVSRSRVYSFIKSGKLRSVSFPGGISSSVRLQRADIEAYRRDRNPD